ncbi:RnfABCDGE type electron transport complex subunit D [Planctomycetota bacterium]
MAMLIRIGGEYPKGVMYSIRLMNVAISFINRFCRIIPNGGKLNA